MGQYDVPPGSLVINLAGLPTLDLGIAPFFGPRPDWLPWKEEWAPDPIHEIVLHWQDMSPPKFSTLFWVDLLDDIVENFSNVFICCGAGIGRTGTTLVAFLLCCGWDVSDAIEYVRDKYLAGAVETNGQIEYLCGMYSEVSGKTCDVDAITDAFGVKKSVPTRVGGISDTRGHLGPLEGHWVHDKFAPTAGQTLLDSYKLMTTINEVTGKWVGGVFHADVRESVLTDGSFVIRGTRIGWRFHATARVTNSEFNRTSYDQGLGRWISDNRTDIFVLDNERL